MDSTRIRGEQCIDGIRGQRPRRAGSGCVRRRMVGEPAPEDRCPDRKGVRTLGGGAMSRGRKRPIRLMQEGGGLHLAVQQLAC